MDAAVHPSSRIEAARGRAEQAKTALLAAALIAFFGAMAAERGAVRKANAGSPTVVVTDEDSDGFQSGGITPAQGAPSTSTGTS
jgi:hypothetical protein